MLSNRLAPGSGLPRHDIVRTANNGERPLDKNIKSSTIGQGATMNQSREIAFLITKQTNAVTFGSGGSLNIFA